MHGVLAMVLAGERTDELEVLTHSRPKSAIPFGGTYRIVDFPLSNLMNSGVQHIGVLPQYMPYSLMHHIGDGSSWDMASRSSSLHVLPPFTGVDGNGWYRGSADAVHHNLAFIKRMNPERVLILRGDHIYYMDYRKLLSFHLENGAAATVVCSTGIREMPAGVESIVLQGETAEGGKLNFAGPGNHIDGRTISSRSIYLVETDVLLEALEASVVEAQAFDFDRDVLPEMMRNHPVYGYRFAGPFQTMDTVNQYYRASMALLGDQPDLDPESWRVRTNLANRTTEDAPGTKFGVDAEVANALVSSGCQVFGTVENSILFPGVFVGPDAIVKDAVVMADTVVQRGAVINRAIVDSDVCIGEGAIVGSRTGKRDSRELAIVGQRAIVTEDATVPPGSIVHPGNCFGPGTAEEAKLGDQKL